MEVMHANVKMSPCRKINTVTIPLCNIHSRMSSGDQAWPTTERCTPALPTEKQRIHLAPRSNTTTSTSTTTSSVASGRMLPTSFSLLMLTVPSQSPPSVQPL
eukprot:PhF_6_TR10616/c1_g1_i1/m.17153